MVQNPVVFDIETSVIADIEKYADDLSRPPSRMKDPEKIAKWLDEAKSKQANFAALDLDLARAVAVCWTMDGKRIKGGLAKNEDEERELLKKFWKATHAAQTFTYIGFNILDFDLPLAMRRSEYLGVPYPALDVSRFRHNGSVDLMQVLTFDGKITARRMDFYFRRFGLTCDIADEHTGADVPVLVSAGKWDDVLRHCAADVKKEWLLAERLGIVQPPQPPPVIPTDQAF